MVKKNQTSRTYLIKQQIHKINTETRKVAIQGPVLPVHDTFVK